MKLYLKLLMFTLMISDARIIVNEIMRESAESPMVQLLFTAGNERARKKHDVRISLLILHRVVSFLQL